MTAGYRGDSATVSRRPRVLDLAMGQQGLNYVTSVRYEILPERFGHYCI